jgi:hypothetical protein
MDSMVKLTHSVCRREQWYALGDVEDAGTKERGDVAEQAADLEPDVPGEVVIQPAAEFDGLDDGGEVVVGQDHHRGFLGHLGAGAHRDPDVGLLHRGRVVDAVPGHRDDLAFLPQDAGQADLVLGADAGDHAYAVDLGQCLLVAHGGELGAGEHGAVDAELAGDRGRSDRVVAGDHPDPDAGRLRRRDRCPGGGPGRVDDADQGEQLQPGDQREQVGAGVERGRVEVLRAIAITRRPCWPSRWFSARYRCRNSPSAGAGAASASATVAARASS